ncbi:MAG: NUDIX domain-containing protein [Candidatus Woesearchaeota archaeon]
MTHPKGATDVEWYFPGDGIDDEETEEETFFREIHEELGLKKEDFISYKNTCITYRYNWPEELIKKHEAQGKYIGVVGQEKKFFLGVIKSDTKIDLTITNELDGAKWFSWDELFKIIPFENIKEVLRNNETLFRK